MKLLKKVALVTGGAHGIGYAIAKALHSEGAITLMIDIDKQGIMKAAEEIGENAVGFHLDISNVDQIKKVMDDIIEKYKRIDILVNNAGILHDSSIEDTTQEEWDRVLAVNLRGAFFLSQQAVAHMKPQRFGRIINISSVAGRNGGLEVGSAYAASKAGIIGMSWNIARKVASFGITVNVIAPGPTESDIGNQFSSSARARLIENIPVKRFGSPEEIAEAVIFLASDTSAFITGTVLDVNGGIQMG